MIRRLQTTACLLVLCSMVLCVGLFQRDVLRVEEPQQTSKQEAVRTTQPQPLQKNRVPLIRYSELPEFQRDLASCHDEAVRRNVEPSHRTRVYVVLNKEGGVQVANASTERGDYALDRCVERLLQRVHFNHDHVGSYFRDTLLFHGQGSAG